jgi:hypothetical protein
MSQAIADLPEREGTLHNEIHLYEFAAGLFTPAPSVAVR